MPLSVFAVTEFAKAHTQRMAWHGIATARIGSPQRFFYRHSFSMLLATKRSERHTQHIIFNDTVRRRRSETQFIPSHHTQFELQYGLCGCTRFHGSEEGRKQRKGLSMHYDHRTHRQFSLTQRTQSTHARTHAVSNKTTLHSNKRSAQFSHTAYEG